MADKIRLGVRQLVEFLLRSGDIDSRYVEKERMNEGSRAHRALQKKNVAAFTEYRSEVALSCDAEREGLAYTLEGRADGVFLEGDQTFVDEIKTTVLPLEKIGEDFNRTHWAQAECYAWMLSRNRQLPAVSVQLTYYNLDTEEVKRFRREYSAAELDAFVSGLLEDYAVWAGFSAEWKDLRDATIKARGFPFPAFRKGQRALAAAVYHTVAAGRKLFAQAPTGTGKTMSALFPAVKAMGEGKTSKIFYLTAKTVTRQAAENALDRLRAPSGEEAPLRLKSVTLTAKEKICFCEKTVCNPENCAFAKGHFDRVNDALLDALRGEDRFPRATVEKYARRHRVCPFEFSLDLSVFCDCVVCDYNYVFDPQAYLRRFFTESGDYVFLIDEAHNLPDRARDMFSSQLLRSDFLAFRKKIKGRARNLERALLAVNRQMLALRKACGDEIFSVAAAFPADFGESVDRFVSACEEFLAEHREFGEDNDFLRLYFDAIHFSLIAGFYDERYVTFVETAGGDVTVRLFCLDPSRLLAEAMKRGGSAVLFSATFTPLPYFRDVLGGGPEDRLLALDSPFERTHLCLLAAGTVSTRYQSREASVGPIVRYLAAFFAQKTGNYIVYFPSYLYMSEVYDAFSAAHPEYGAVMQQSSMTEEERETFLAAFRESPKKTYVAFCVLGGVFSEGIDLPGSRLIGTAIVGVGLPRINARQNVVRAYYEKQNGRGFEYAYMYPGMNKVLQAAGRVIRGEEDRGAVLLIDDRFRRADYRALFPAHWSGCRYIGSPDELGRALRDFWKTEVSPGAVNPAADSKY